MRLVRLLARQAAQEHYANMHVDSASDIDSTSSSIAAKSPI